MSHDPRAGRDPADPQQPAAARVAPSAASTPSARASSPGAAADPRAAAGPSEPPGGATSAAGADAATTSAAPSTSPLTVKTLALVADLERVFRTQVERTLGQPLDTGPIALAFVDHYLSLARHERRAPVLELLAAGAGAWFGELVRREVGGTWIGDGVAPRRLRLLLAPQCLHFSPADVALQAIVSEELDPSDERLPAGEPAFDPRFRVRATAGDEASLDDDPPTETELLARWRDEAATAGELPPPWVRGGEGTPPVEDDARWLEARLAELPPVPEDQFHSLTGRYETLTLMLELLAAKQLSDGRAPRTWSLSDYMAVFAGPARPGS